MQQQAQPPNEPLRLFMFVPELFFCDSADDLFDEIDTDLPSEEDEPLLMIKRL